MKTSVSAKRCPECGKVTMLHATECAACGHRFRTRFEALVERTEAFDALMLPRPPAPPAHPIAPRCRGLSAFAQAFLGSFCLVAIIGMAAWVALSFSQGIVRPAPAVLAPVAPVVSSPTPSSFSGTPRHGRAEYLYERIETGMSLYDVDQAAGGMGRVARSSDSHVLLLSYDYPDQSVRVSLYRGDLTGADYRVQAVALYHGNTLLHRHADDN